MNIVTPNVINVLTVFGSPNKNSNTMKLYKKVISEVFNDMDINVTMFYAYDNFVNPCIDCKNCSTGECLYNTDKMGDFIKFAKEADVIIFATPVYFNGVPAPLKAVIDRLQQFFRNKLVSQKQHLGILLTTAGSDDMLVTTALNDVFKMVFSSLNTQFVEHFAVTNTDNIQDYSLEAKQIDNVITKIRRLNFNECK